MNRLLTALALTCLCGSTTAQSPYNTPLQHGPATVNITPRAQAELPRDHIWRKSLKVVGRMSSGAPIRDTVYSISPNDERWIAEFTYVDAGHVRDSGPFDAIAMRNAIRDANEKDNLARVLAHELPVRIIGWERKPRYNTQTNWLSWILIRERDGIRTRSFEARLLGRVGYLSVSLTTTPERFNRSVREVDTLMQSVSFVESELYATYAPGQKTADLDLQSLVTGGTPIAPPPPVVEAMWPYQALGFLMVTAVVGARKLFAEAFSTQMPERLWD